MNAAYDVNVGASVVDVILSVLKTDHREVEDLAAKGWIMLDGRVVFPKHLLKSILSFSNPTVEHVVSCVGGQTRSFRLTPHTVSDAIRLWTHLGGLVLDLEGSNGFSHLHFVKSIPGRAGGYVLMGWYKGEYGLQAPYGYVTPWGDLPNISVLANHQKVIEVMTLFQPKTYSLPHDLEEVIMREGGGSLDFQTGEHMWLDPDTFNRPLTRRIL